MKPHTTAINTPLKHNAETYAPTKTINKKWPWFTSFTHILHFTFNFWFTSFLQILNILMKYMCTTPTNQAANQLNHCYQLHWYGHLITPTESVTFTITKSLSQFGAPEPDKQISHLVAMRGCCVTRKQTSRSSFSLLKNQNVKVTYSGFSLV